MVGDHQRPRAGPKRVHLAAQPRERRVGREQVLGRNAPHCDHQGRGDELDLPIEVAAAVRRLIGPRVAIAGRAALEHIGDVDVLATEADRLQHGREQLPAASDEGLAPPVLLRPRRFADEHPARPGVTDPEHGLRARLAEGAARAGGHRRPQRVPVEARFGPRRTGRCRGDRPDRLGKWLGRCRGGRQRTSYVHVHAERLEVGEPATVAHRPRSRHAGGRPPADRGGRRKRSRRRHTHTAGPDAA